MFRLKNFEDYRDYKFFFIETTENCNLNCSYCYYAHKGNQKATFNPEETIEYLFDKYKKVIICFLGGEPFLNSEFMEKMMGRFSNNKNIIYSTNTNGTLFKNIKQNFLKDFSFHYISINGNKEYHDMLSGKGVYNKIIENINFLKDRSDSVIIARMTITDPRQLRVIPEFVNVFDGVYWQINNTITQLDDNFLNLYKDCLEEIFLFWKNHFLNVPNFSIIPFVGMSDLIMEGGLQNPDLICGAGTNHVCLCIDGSVFPCPETPHRLGNIEMLGDLYNFSFKSYEPKKKCKTCNIFSYCGGRCAMTHDLLYCQTTQFLFELIKDYILNLDENEKISVKEMIKYQINLSYTSEIIP